jgi:hypothetical protein
VYDASSRPRHRHRYRTRKRVGNCKKRATVVGEGFAVGGKALSGSVVVAEDKKEIGIKHAPFMVRQLNRRKRYFSPYRREVIGWLVEKRNKITASHIREGRDNTALTTSRIICDRRRGKL